MNKQLLDPTKKRKLEETEIDSNFPNQKFHKLSSEIIEDDNDSLFVYTDGSASNNGADNCRAAFSVYFGENDKRNHSSEIFDNPSNNRAELYAILHAITIVIRNGDTKKFKSIIIYSDRYSFSKKKILFFFLKKKKK